jgi:hypothetical protein
MYGPALLAKYFLRAFSVIKKAFLPVCLRVLAVLVIIDLAVGMPTEHPKRL